jgi:hypothetical protein
MLIFVGVHEGKLPICCWLSIPGIFHILQFQLHYKRCISNKISYNGNVEVVIWIKFPVMSFAIIDVPAAPVRKKPGHRKEMSNQLLFGEMVEILKEKGSLWVKIRSLHDDYEGWMTRTLLRSAETSVLDNGTISSRLIAEIPIEGYPVYLPAGAHLPLVAQEKSGGEDQLKEDDEMKTGVATGDKAEQLAIQWLNAPYMWGGRTILGVDCSGFMQVIFKLLGISLPRDAWQQAQTGQSVRKLKDAQKGDLAFFNDKEEIVHVGMLLGTDRIIHSSGRVRIDRIDKKGIINSDTGQRTHRLEAIRRVL